MKKIFSLLVIAMFAFTGCYPSSEDPSTVNVSRVTLNKQSLNLLVNATFTLVATIEPNDATEKGVTWVSSNPTAVAINAEGVVQALAVGEATITATAGGLSATCAVTVTKSKVDVTGITLNEETLSLRVNTKFALEVLVEPNNATVETLTLVSSNPAVATVNSEGVVEALAVGEATITITIDGCSATCTVTVFQLDPPKVNDFYYSDGTWSTDLQRDKTCIGIVFAINFDQSSMRNPAATSQKPFPPYINDPSKPDLKNLVVALEDLGDVTVWDTANFFSEIVKTNATDWFNGANNSNNPLVLANLDKLPPFKRVYDKRTPEHEWYLPSTYELFKLMLVFNGQNEPFKFDASMSETARFALYQQERNAFNARLIEAGGENAKMYDSQPKPITGFDDMPQFDGDTPEDYTKWRTEVWDPWYAANPGYQVALDTYAMENRLLNYWSSTSLDDYIPGQENNYMMCAISFSCITPDFSIFPYKDSPENAAKVRPILSFKY